MWSIISDRLTNFLLLMFSFCLFVPKLNAVNSIVSVLTALVVIIAFRKDIFKELCKIPCMLKYAFLIFCLSLVISSTAVGDKECIKKAFDYIYYVTPLILLFLLGRVNNNQKWILWGFVIGVAVTSIYGLYDFIIFDRRRLGGLYSHSNHTGGMLAIMLPLTIAFLCEHLREKYSDILLKIVALISCGAGILALFLTGSRGAILGVILGFVVSCMLYAVKNFDSKKIMAFLLIVSLIVGASLFALYKLNGNKFSRHYDGERLLLMESSYSMWNDNKLFGIGLVNWKEQYQSKYILPQAKEPELGTPHNTVAFYFSTTGLVGGIGFVVFSLLILKYLYSGLIPFSGGGLVCFGMLWAFCAMSLHGLVDLGITKKEIFRLFCGMLGLTASIIEFLRVEYNKIDI